MRQFIRASAVVVATAALVMVGSISAQATTGETTWDGLAGAFSNVGVGASDTIQLDADLNSSTASSTQPYLAVATNGTSGATITLDLHGHSLTIAPPNWPNPAIFVPVGATLIIEDTVGGGTLNATGAGGAGIGGDGGQMGDAGTIIINSGTVRASAGLGGNSFSAGIGGGYYGRVFGGITINGGTVTAIGDEAGAGIGSGNYGWPDCNNLAPITITGGIVTATGGSGAAGIGAGFQNCSSDIAISGGVVTAIGGARVTAAQANGGGAGIGTGATSSYQIPVSSPAINLIGGTVVATGGPSAAGIGAGAGDGSNPVPMPTITVGGCVQVTATGGSDSTNYASGAGIGTGAMFIGTLPLSTLSLPGALTGGSATTTADGAGLIHLNDRGFSFGLGASGSSLDVFTATAVDGFADNVNSTAAGGVFTLTCVATPTPAPSPTSSASTMPTTGLDAKASIASICALTLLGLIAMALSVVVSRRRND